MTLPEDIEQAAAQRFVRWDGALWRDIVAGPARDLAEGLHRSGPGGEPVLESYLRLAAEGIGLGYLFPSRSAERRSFFTHAWTTLVPVLLPSVPRDRQAAALAACWNLGENLEASPVWLRRIFLALADRLDRLDDLGAVVGSVAREVFEPPAVPLDGTGRVAWLRFAGEERSFLPGALHFLAPAVICVHPRHGGDGCQAAWLCDPPILLGAVACDASTPLSLDAEPLFAAVGDRRAGEPLAAVRNAWRAAATFKTSQSAMVVLP